MGLDAESKLAVSWYVGGRDSEAAMIFMDDLAKRLANRVQLTSDGHKAYLEAVEGAFGSDFDYAMLVKVYGPALGGQRRYSPAECIGAVKHPVEGNWEQAGLSLLGYVAAQPEFVGRFRKVGFYLAIKILVSDLRHGLFSTLARDLRDFKRAGLIDGNFSRMWRDHREVRKYRRAMSNREALARLAGAPAEWI
jgi:hypothetical protein